MLKNTVTVRLGLGSFLNYLGIGIGVGVTVSVSLKICAFLVALWRITLRWPGRWWPARSTGHASVVTVE